MEPRRRLFLAEPGESLILANSAITIAERHGEFAVLTGLSLDNIAVSPLVSIPMPIQSKSAGPRGWQSNAEPSAFWNPLFWLPQRVARRYRFDDNAEGSDIETESEWLVRVSLELTISELYNPADGTWLDILSVVGLDIDDPSVQDRVAAWLAGGADEDLDSIDLTETLDDPADPHWALTGAAELLPILAPATWAVIADDLAQECGDVVLASEDADLSTLIDRVSVISNLALATLSDVPSGDTDGEAPNVRWAEIATALRAYTGDVTALVSGELDELSESLYAIRDDYWPFVEVLNKEIAEQASHVLPASA